MKKQIIQITLSIILVCAMCVLLTSCNSLLEYALGSLQQAKPADEPAEDAADSEISDSWQDEKISEPATPEPATPEPWPAAAALAAIEQFPYFGDKNKCTMSAEQALVYAEAVRTASGAVSDDYDKIIPMLIDIVGDGVPLLLIIPTPGEPPMPIFSCLLFGYSNGRIQEIARGWSIVRVMVDGEYYLCLFYEIYDMDDAYIKHHFYDVINGEALLYSETELTRAEDFMGMDPPFYYIDGVEVDSDSFYSFLDAFKFINEQGEFFTHSHSSYNYFESGDVVYRYLDYPFDRAAVAQMLIDYAKG